MAAIETSEHIRHVQYVATYSAESTLIAPFPIDCNGRNNSPSVLVSPDGHWLAADCYYTDQSLKIVSLDGTNKWIIPYEEMIQGENIMSLTSLTPLYWSQDGSYLYFTRWPCCIEPDGIRSVSDDYGRLYRFDTSTGTWANILATSEFGNYYSFSPTGRRLIYINNHIGWMEPRTVLILDLRTGDTISISIEGYDAGSVAWSGDGLGFVFAAAQQENNFANYLFSVYLYDLESQTLIPLSLASPEMCEPQEWTDEDILILTCTTFDANWRFLSRYTHQIDLSTILSTLPNP
jgi:hypothetical protein